MKKHQILLITSLLILTSFNLSIVSCSSDSNSKENDNIENENNNQEETTKKEETLLATFSKESCINLVNSPKTTDGIYLINDDVTDIINDITLKYSTNVGLTGNSNYPNCIQVKKQTNNNFIISTYKKITKIIITSLKDTSYDTTYATLELNVNSSMNEEINTTSGISEIKNTYLLNEEASTIALSNTSSRAMYLQKLEIIGYDE
ncbi:MAG: hypothetical protein MSC51_05270 [Mollicutes bacterium]|nr:hypothetical protein [Mollicutes bacterium]MDY3994847.1 hypothetical protein [Candidatus Onthovivens sp.]